MLSAKMTHLDQKKWLNELYHLFCGFFSPRFPGPCILGISQIMCISNGNRLPGPLAPAVDLCIFPTMYLLRTWNWDSPPRPFVQLWPRTVFVKDRSYSFPLGLVSLPEEYSYHSNCHFSYLRLESRENRYMLPVHNHSTYTHLGWLWYPH